jgi:hypothetical protein
VTAVAAPPQAIAGVSPGQERVIEIFYPSVAAGGLGRLIGTIMNSIPVEIWGVKLSYIIFGLPLAPLGLALYLGRALFGGRYVLTNRSISNRTVGGRVIKEVALKDVAEVAIDSIPGQEFHHAADVVILNAKEDEILRLAGINRPDRVRHVILDARNARRQNDESLANINKRG